MNIAQRDRWLCAALSVLALAIPASAGAVGCTASVPALALGNYNVFSASPLQSATTLSVNCAKGAGDPAGTISVAYTIALSTGSSLTYAQRKLANGAETLNYNLYRDSSRTLIWGDGTGGSQTVASSMNLTGGNPSRTNTHTIYGQVSALQNAGVGSYSDNVVVTVTY